MTYWLSRLSNINLSNVKEKTCQGYPRNQAIQSVIQPKLSEYECHEGPCPVSTRWFASIILYYPKLLSLQPYVSISGASTMITNWQRNASWITFSSHRITTLPHPWLVYPIRSTNTDVACHISPGCPTRIRRSLGMLVLHRWQLEKRTQLIELLLTIIT